MSLREKMMRIYQKKGKGEIPWAAYGGFLLPSGDVEREIRNMGCGLIKWHPVCSWIPPGMAHMNGWVYESEIRNTRMSIKMIWEGNKKIIVRKYETPIGNIFEKLEEDPIYHSLWVKKFLVERIDEYKVMKYIIENAVLRENYNMYMELTESLGDDGVVLGVIDRSPWQKMLLEIIGIEKIFYHLFDNISIVEDLLYTLEQKEIEALGIIAKSPAEIIWMVDNVTGDVTSPEIFAKYCLPFYNKVADILHKNNKYLVIHLDGKLKSLKGLIKKSHIDVVESFTLPEGGGDISIEEASKEWKDKSIIANIPAFLCYRNENEVRTYIKELLKKVSPMQNFMLEVSENLPHPYWKKILPAIADVLKNQ